MIRRVNDQFGFIRDKSMLPEFFCKPANLMLALVLAIWQFGLNPTVLAEQDDYYPSQRSWMATNAGSENISLFVFRDRNGNGRYDPGEYPMANVAVNLFRPDGSRVVRRSNRYGFVNFVNSLTIPGVAIGVEGKYHFEVIAPPGWQVTSDNARQTAQFTVRPRTRAGIVADRVPHPIGIAPILRISGRVVARAEGGGLSPVSGALVSASSSSGHSRQETATDDLGKFAFEVESGSWLVQLQSPETNVQVKRKVHVDHAPIHVSAIILDEQIPSEMAVQIPVDFDRVSSVPITKMPTHPRDLEWVNLIVSDNETYRGSGYVNNTVSGNHIGYNSSGYPVTVTRDEPFDFVGAYFGVAWPQAEGETLDVRAWRDEQLVGEEVLSLSAMGPFWFEADYRRITRIEFATRHFWQFVMDEPVFRFPD